MTRIQLVAIVGAAGLLLTVLEMVRRRRLMERYALLWILSATVLLVLALWSGGLARISHAIGVIYAPNALFFVGIGFILLLLLHFSAAVSRLSDQADTLAQHQALLEEQLRRREQTDLPIEQLRRREQTDPPIEQLPAADGLLAEQRRSLAELDPDAAAPARYRDPAQPPDAT
jgi:hypothetical protein